MTIKVKRYIHHEINEPTTLRGKLFASFRHVVFGLEDGIVSTLGALTGIAGGVQQSSIVILSGFVIIFVESLSMAAGTFLSQKSEVEVEEKMLEEEREEIENDPEGERKELEHFYKERGFTPNEVAMMVNRVTQDKELWLEEMAYRELGIVPNKQGAPKMDALFMGLSYIVGGTFPLASYLLFPLHVALPISVLSSVLFLFFIGYVKGHLVSIGRVRSGLEMMLVSLTAAGLGYVVGRIVSSMFDIRI